MISRRSILQYLGIATASVTCPAIALGASQASVPTAAILPPVEAFLPCDGRRLSRKVYSQLFEVIGRSFTCGLDDGATFDLPDLRSTRPNLRPMMCSGIGNEFVSIGTILYLGRDDVAIDGGDGNHTHTHAFAPSSHSHSFTVA